jgi:hypothetical protein
MSRSALAQLEAAFRRNGYEVRYVKGSFRGGACRVIDKHLVVINALIRRLDGCACYLLLQP